MNPNTPEYMNAEINESTELDYRDTERIKKLLSRFTGGKFLDVGCHTSPLAVEAKKALPKSEVYALDHSDKLIEHFGKKHPEVNYVCSDCYKMPFEDNFFDYVVAGELIEHLDKPQAFINEAHRVMKKGAILAMTTPCEERDGELGGKYHVQSFTLDDVAWLIKDFSHIEIGMTFTPRTWPKDAGPWVLFLAFAKK